LIFETVEDVYSFFDFKRVMELGVVVPFDAVPFDKLMLYGWISEAMNGR
jgi:hypothetical protein